MARVEGFEPPLTILEIAVLPLHQTRKWRRVQDSNLRAREGERFSKPRQCHYA